MMQREAIEGLRRSRNACLGGVCAGIAQRYDVDPIIIRILALLAAAVTFGLAALAYVALWAALPQEPLSSELYDIAPEQAESSAYGCVDCSKSAHLRGDGETFGMTGSPLGDKVRWVNIPSAEYGGIFKKKGREAFIADFRVFLDERIDVAYALLLEHLVHSNQDASLLYIAKTIIDGSPEEFHGG